MGVRLHAQAFALALFHLHLKSVIFHVQSPFLVAHSSRDLQTVFLQVYRGESRRFGGAGSGAFLCSNKAALLARRPRKQPTQLRTKYPRQTRLSTRNWAGFFAVSGEIADRSVVQGGGLDAGTRKAI